MGNQREAVSYGLDERGIPTGTCQSRLTRAKQTEDLRWVRSVSGHKPDGSPRNVKTNSSSGLPTSASLVIVRAKTAKVCPGMGRGLDDCLAMDRCWVFASTLRHTHHR